MHRNSAKVGSVKRFYFLYSYILQSPVYAIEYEERHFRPDLHVRYHASNADQGSNETRKRAN